MPKGDSKHRSVLDQEHATFSLLVTGQSSIDHVQAISSCYAVGSIPNLRAPKAWTSSDVQGVVYNYSSLQVVLQLRSFTLCGL